MYQCENCKAIFENAISIDPGTGEQWLASPCCQEGYITVNQCECGEVKEEDEILCDDCKETTLKIFKKFLETFTENEIKYLNEYYDGERF